MFVLTVRRKIRSSDTLHEFLERYCVIFNWIIWGTFFFAKTFGPKLWKLSVSNGKDF